MTANTRLLSIHKITFSLNLGFAIALVVFFFLLQRSVLGKSGFANLFAEITTRINLMLDLDRRHGAGETVLLAALTIAFFLLLLLFLRLLDGTRAIRLILNPAAGVAALTAVPVSCVLFYKYSLLANLSLWPLAALELTAIGAALFLSRKRPSPIWFFVLVLHYSFWGWVLWDHPWVRDVRSYSGSGARLVFAWPLILSLVSPCTGFVWVLYVQRLRQIETNPQKASP